MTTDELLSAYIDGQVTSDERQRVEMMLQSDPAAKQALARMGYAVRLVNDVPPVPVPHAFTLTEAMVGQGRAGRNDWLAWLRPAYLRMAAAVVAVFLLLLVGGNFAWQANLPAAPDAAVATIERGGLAPEEGDPSAVAAKASASEQAAHPVDQFLGLAPGVLLALEIGLAALLVLLLLASWQLSRAT